MRKFKISVLLKLGFYCLFLSIGLEMQARKFVHPGILHTTKSIERMRAQIADKEYPAYGSFELLKSHHCSQADYQPFGPFDTRMHTGNKDEKKNPNNVRTDSFEIIPSESEEKDKGVNEEKNDENK